MVIFQGGTRLLARAALPPQVSCSVHYMPASRVLLQGLQQEGGLIHSEKPTAKRQGRRQVGEIASRARTDPSHTHTSACDTKYSCRIPARKSPYPFTVPIGSLEEVQATSGM